MIDLRHLLFPVAVAGFGVLKLVVLFLVVLLLIGFGILGIILRGLFGFFYWLRGGGGGGNREGGGRERREERASRFGGRSRRANGDEAERMRACAFCGVHVPESEGVRAAGAFFCCDEHRRAHGEAGGK
ncbi:MAG: hypothetical protein LBF50_09370 [Azoarcus sp.]|nr:hypothetical protein [Azoarcus sp.]